MTFNIDKTRAQCPILSREINGYPLTYLDDAASALEKLREWLAV